MVQPTPAAAAAPLTVLTGASRGMGLALVQQLLAQGSDLLCIARHPSRELEARATQLGRSCTQWEADLGLPGDANAQLAARLAVWLAERSARPPGGVTLINNAAMIPGIAPLSQCDPADLARALRVNLEAPLLLTSAFLRATADWPVPRRVLNISSGLGRRAMASQTTYCASKAGMDHFTRCVALEEAAHPNGARVCALAPGVIDTDMQTRLREASARAFPDQPAFAALKAKGQLTSPEDAARRVLAWLARPDFGLEPVADVRG